MTLTQTLLFDVEVEEKRKELVKMQVWEAEEALAHWQTTDVRCWAGPIAVQNCSRIPFPFPIVLVIVPIIHIFILFFVLFSTFQEMNDGLVDDLNTKGCFWHDSQISALKLSWRWMIFRCHECCFVVI